MSCYAKKKKEERILLSKYPGFSLEGAKAKDEEAKAKAEKAKQLPGLLRDYSEQIRSWLGERNLTLIYQGTRDGFNSVNFHQKCDNKGETLTVIKSTASYLFGGYTPITWTSRGNYAWDQRTFIFTLTNPYNTAPTKFTNTGPRNDNAYSIYDNSSYGPTFGGGNDIYVANQCNQNNSSGTGFPHSFADSIGQGNNTFTGSTNFQVSEIEVFEVS